MKFAAGKDKHGKVQLTDDGHPAYYVSDCGKYNVSRCLNGSGVIYDAWCLQFDKAGRRELPINLVTTLSSGDAIKACKAHEARTSPRGTND